MTLPEVVARARSASGSNCIYELGKGGMVPWAEVPWDEAKHCDCSGLAMWCLYLSRHQGDDWINTDRMVTDGKTPGGLFEQIPWELAKPGHLIVYGRGGPGKYGHVGVVSDVDVTGPIKAVHCSKGNFKKTGDAIQETGVGVWRLRADTIIVRCLQVVES